MSGKKMAVVLTTAAAIGLTIYLGGQLLLALLVVKGCVPEEGTMVLQIVLAGTGAFLCGLWAVKRLPLGALTASVAAVGVMGAVVILLGLLCYEKMAPADEIGPRLALMAFGAFLAAVTGATGSGRSRKKQPIRSIKRKK